MRNVNEKIRMAINGVLAVMKSVRQKGGCGREKKKLRKRKKVSSACARVPVRARACWPEAGGRAPKADGGRCGAASKQARGGGRKKQARAEMSREASWAGYCEHMPSPSVRGMRAADARQRICGRVMGSAREIAMRATYGGSGGIAMCKLRDRERG